MKKINWFVMFALVAVHVCAIAGLFFWSWEGFTMCVGLCIVTGLGVTIGYHRYLTHGGFETYRPIRWAITVAGLLAGEGPPMYWVAFHRKHHQFSDEDDDPHSPKQGFWHAHMLWFLYSKHVSNHAALFKRYARDLCRDRFICALNYAYLWLHAALFLLLAAAGYVYGGWYYAASFAAYGFFIRMVIVLNITWMVNSVTHVWGYRNYETGDRSTNNWLIGILAFGEGWHNNHHKYPVLARHGHRWWEIDTSYWMIKCMHFFGLVWNVRDTLPY